VSRKRWEPTTIIGSVETFSELADSVSTRFNGNLVKAYNRRAAIEEADPGIDFDQNLLESTYIGNVFNFYFGGWMKAKGMIKGKEGTASAGGFAAFSSET
jgi:hypothetical protein